MKKISKYSIALVLGALSTSVAMATATTPFIFNNTANTKPMFVYFSYQASTNPANTLPDNLLLIKPDPKNSGEFIGNKCLPSDSNFRECQYFNPNRFTQFKIPGGKELTINLPNNLISARATISYGKALKLPKPSYTPSHIKFGYFGEIC
ncbi:hypothetical protein L3V83_15795 [Thiotrichales bacterium 19X7-9]|nr:hypothetical protein [Thiotrichales bacterium 19X7-9]